MNNLEMGSLGESVAARYLQRNGYLILAQNFRTKTGEIDIVAKINDEIHFVEVKLRKNRDFGDAHEAVNWKKQRTIKKVATEYLNQCRSYYNDLFFDIVEVYSEEKLINFIENAF